MNKINPIDTPLKIELKVHNSFLIQFTEYQIEWKVNRNFPASVETPTCQNNKQIDQTTRQLASAKTLAAAVWERTHKADQNIGIGLRFTGVYYN